MFNFLKIAWWHGKDIKMTLWFKLMHFSLFLSLVYCYYSTSVFSFGGIQWEDINCKLYKWIHYYSKIHYCTSYPYGILCQQWFLRALHSKYHVDQKQLRWETYTMTSQQEDCIEPMKNTGFCELSVCLAWTTTFHLLLTELDVRLALLKAGRHSFAPSATTVCHPSVCQKAIDCVILSRLPERHERWTAMRSPTLDSARSRHESLAMRGRHASACHPPAVHGKGRGIVAALCPQAIQTQMRWVCPPTEARSSRDNRHIL